MNDTETLYNSIEKIQTAWELTDQQMAKLAQMELEAFLTWKKRESLSEQKIVSDQKIVKTDCVPEGKTSTHSYEGALQSSSNHEFEGRREGPTIPFGMDSAVVVVSIYKALERKFSDLDERMKWLFKENTDFDGNKPIDIMTSSQENLYWVSYYLDSSRQ